MAKPTVRSILLEKIPQIVDADGIFIRSELLKFADEIAARIDSKGLTIHATISRTLQLIGDAGDIEFVRSGVYRLRSLAEKDEFIKSGAKRNRRAKMDDEKAKVMEIAGEGEKVKVVEIAGEGEKANTVNNQRARLVNNQRARLVNNQRARLVNNQVEKRMARRTCQRTSRSSDLGGDSGFIYIITSEHYRPGTYKAGRTQQRFGWDGIDTAKPSIDRSISTSECAKRCNSVVGSLYNRYRTSLGQRGCTVYKLYHVQSYKAAENMLLDALSAYKCDGEIVTGIEFETLVGIYEIVAEAVGYEAVELEQISVIRDENR